jgi:uncharacterized surface protein with fasciclin (FAS1) repeats
MKKVQRKAVAAAGLTAVAVFGAAACSGSNSSQPSAEASTGSSVMTAPATNAAADPANLVGPGCAAYAAQVPTGPGSVSGMAQEPVTVAASNNPMLKTLTSALTGKLNPNVNLVDTLNNGQFTVFAPTDDAFAKVDSATIEKLKTDSNLLTSVLTYHVVSGQATPMAVVGDHKTVQGAALSVTGAGNNLEVANAGLVCGGVRTANATVYMIDTVLMPPAG